MYLKFGCGQEEQLQGLSCSMPLTVILNACLGVGVGFFCFGNIQDISGLRAAPFPFYYVLVSPVSAVKQKLPAAVRVYYSNMGGLTLSTTDFIT